MHQLVNDVEHVLHVGFGKVIAIGAEGGAVGLGCQGARFGVEPMVAALRLDDLLHHVGGRAARHVFVHEDDAAGFL